MILQHWHRLRQIQMGTGAGPLDVFVTNTNSGRYNEPFGGSVTVDNLVEDDLVLGFIGAHTGRVTPPTSTGWSTFSPETTSMQMRVVYKYVGASETSATFSVSAGTTDLDGYITLVAIRNARTTNSQPFDGTGLVYNNANNASSLTPDDITTNNDGCLIITCIIIENDKRSSLSIPTGYANEIEAYGGGFVNAFPLTTSVDSKFQTTAGTESPASYSWSNNDPCRVVTLAIRPE